MTKWHQTEKGLIEIGDNGIPTGNVHAFTYHDAHGHIMRVKHNADGSSVPEIMIPRHFIGYHPETGALIGSNSGFSLAAELGHPEPHVFNAQDGTKAVVIEVSALPADFKPENYRWDIKQKKLVAADQK
jgi:hypothetical protein